MCTRFVKGQCLDAQASCLVPWEYMKQFLKCWQQILVPAAIESSQGPRNGVPGSLKSSRKEYTYFRCDAVIWEGLACTQAQLFFGKLLDIKLCSIASIEVFTLSRCAGTECTKTRSP